MEKGLQEIAKAEVGMVEGIIENYFVELKKAEELENKIKLLREEASESKKNISSMQLKLYIMLKDTKSDSLLVEVEGKKIIFELSPSENSVVVKEVVTPKELKTKLAVNKLAGKKSSTSKKPSVGSRDSRAELLRIMNDMRMKEKL